MEDRYNCIDPEKESLLSSPSSYYDTCNTSKASTYGIMEPYISPAVPALSASRGPPLKEDRYSQHADILADQESSENTQNTHKILSPMSQACESSVISGYHPVKYTNKGEMFTEHSLCPGPPEHSRNDSNGGDKSFVGVLSAINSMNLSMNTSRLSSIDLATSLETYAAVIHSRTSSSAEPDKNEACANSFDHAAVFYMEWAAIQAKTQVSLIEDLYKLKDLAVSIESGCNSTIDVDSIRAVIVKLTKTSHESFKEAYEKGSSWSSVGGLDYWAKKLPKPVIKDAPVVNVRPESSKLPQSSFDFTAKDRKFTLEVKDYHRDLTKSKNSSESFGSSKHGTMTDSSDTLCSFKGHDNILESYQEGKIFDKDKPDRVFRRNKERSVHSFKYPNGRSDGNGLTSATNGRPDILRSSDHEIMDFDTIYANAIEKSNNKLQAVADLNTISEETSEPENDMEKDKNAKKGVSVEPDMKQDLSVSTSSNLQSSSGVEKVSEVFRMQNDYQRDDEHYRQEVSADGEIYKTWDTPPSSYLYRPLSYAITEEGTIMMTPPQRETPPEAVATFPNDAPVAAARPANIRRKGKFQRKEDGSILMLPKRAVDDSSSEGDEENKDLNHKGRVVRFEEPEKEVSTTSAGEQPPTPPKLQHIEIPFFDRAASTSIAQPLEPNYNYPDQYPSRGYFSEELAERDEGIASLETSKSLPGVGSIQSPPRWQTRLKKIVGFPRLGEKSAAVVTSPSLKRQLSPDPKNPGSPSTRQKRSN